MERYTVATGKKISAMALDHKHLVCRGEGKMRGK